jgi:phage terminase large subunit-like protein
LHHDGNPVLTWCIGNVVGTADRRGNLYPTKTRLDQQIAAVAVMMVVGHAMAEDQEQVGQNAFLSNPIAF